MVQLYGANIIDDGGSGDGSTTDKAGSLSTISEDIRLILALKDLDTDLQAAWDAFNAGKLDEMYAAIYRSKFYQNNTRIARQRRASQKTQPGAFASELEDWKIKTKKRLVQSGVKITPGIESMLETAYLNGLSDDQLDAAISKAGLIGAIGGETGGTINTLKSYARQYGVDAYYNNAYWDEKSKNLFDGTTTEQDIQSEIRGLSASMFPAFADDINAGRSMEATASYITTILSNRVGRPINISSPEAKQFLQWKNPKTGQFEKVPGWYVDMESWKMPGADQTPEAIAKADNIALRVLQDMGLM